MAGAFLRLKQEIKSLNGGDIVELSKMERMALDFFDDGNEKLTMQRLCMAAMLSPKQDIKKMLCVLIEKLRENKAVRR